MKGMLLVAMAILALGLTGCSQPKGGEIAKTEYVPQAGGSITAEVWVKAPSGSVSCRLHGDVEQDVVCLEYDEGRIALPNRIEHDGSADGQVQENQWVDIAVYHLVNEEGKEVDYYKRRFARGK